MYRIIDLSLINVNRFNLYILAGTVTLLTHDKDVVHVSSLPPQSVGLTNVDTCLTLQNH